MTDDANNVPIDIHCNKLLDWLVNRRHCGKDWQKCVVNVRQKIMLAMRDMPEDERIVLLLQDSYIDYFHCLKIVNVLRDTEKDTKNFLGFYSSQKMNDWTAIVNLYLRDNVYLAESAQTLQRLVQYEVPALKRQIIKLDSTIAECVKKETDYGKQAMDARKNWLKTCTTMGIAGRNLKSELQALAVNLPSFFEQIAQFICRNLDSALDYYDRFLKLQKQETLVVPLLKCILKKGNTLTMFEWRRGYAPKTIEKSPMETMENNGNEQDENDIDFGDMGMENSEEIRMLDDYVAVDNETDGQIALVADEQGVIEEDDIARGEEALSVFEHANGLRMVIAELNELKSFLYFRHLEETQEFVSDIYLAGLENLPSEIKKVRSVEISEWINRITDILAQLKDPQKVHMFKIRSSPHYLDSLVVDLEKKRNAEDRYRGMEQLMRDQQVETGKAVGEANRELSRLMTVARRIQSQLEEEISKKYNNRKVNIMGGIGAVSSS